MRILLAINDSPLAQLLERSFSRFVYDWTKVDNGFDAFQRIITTKYDLLILTYDLPRMQAREVIKRCFSIENFKLPPVIIFTNSEKERHQVEEDHFPRTVVVSRPVEMRRLVSIVQQILQQDIRVACLGGGTGLFTLLSGLKTIPSLSLSSIVSMSDDGGSTGRLRHLFGILPPGDVRRSLVALSTAPDLLNELMQYRFTKGGGLEGHNLGNLLLTALHELRGSMTEAVRSLGEILNIQGNVIPVTETVNTLCAELENGTVLSGESQIGLFDNSGAQSKIKRLWQQPTTSASPDAIEAIFNAKYILLGPGDLFTSIIVNLIAEGIADAIVSSPAKKIFVCNVMTKPSETLNFQVSDHVREISRYLKKDVLDYVICSSTPFSDESVALYALQNQIPVIESRPEVLKSVTRAEIIFADVASEASLVRHDSLKLAAVLKTIFDHSLPV